MSNIHCKDCGAMLGHVHRPGCPKLGVREALMTDRERFEAAMRARGWKAYELEWDVDDYGTVNSRLAWSVWQEAARQERERSADLLKAAKATVAFMLFSSAGMLR